MSEDKPDDSSPEDAPVEDSGHAWDLEDDAKPVKFRPVVEAEDDEVDLTGIPVLVTGPDGRARHNEDYANAVHRAEDHAPGDRAHHGTWGPHHH